MFVFAFHQERKCFYHVHVFRERSSPVLLYFLSFVVASNIPGLSLHPNPSGADSFWCCSKMKNILKRHVFAKGSSANVISDTFVLMFDVKSSEIFRLKCTMWLIVNKSVYLHSKASTLQSLPGNLLLWDKHKYSECVFEQTLCPCEPQCCAGSLVSLCLWSSLWQDATWFTVVCIITRLNSAGHQQAALWLVSPPSAPRLLCFHYKGSRDALMQKLLSLPLSKTLMIPASRPISGTSKDQLV